MPDTIQAVLAARLDRLPPAEKDLLQAASVLGKDIAVPLLQAITEQPEAALQRGLAHLQTAEFLYETRLFPEHTYTFKHALIQEVAYNSLPQVRRRDLHAWIMAALETRAGEGGVEPVERLAYHALRSEVWDKILMYCQQAGEKALARSAYREAVGYIEQALSALPHLPDLPTTREQAIDLRLALHSGLYPSGDMGRSLALLREAEALSTTLDDPRRLGQVFLLLSNHFYRGGAYHQAIAAAQRVLALATPGREVVLHALANRGLGRAYLAQTEYRRAVDCLRNAVAFFDRSERHGRFGQASPPAVDSRAWLVVCYAELGAFVEGRALAEEALQIAEAVAHRGSLMYASWGLGILAVRQGDLPTAVPTLERAVAICQEADLPVWFPIVAAAMGTAYALGGRAAEAVALLTRAMEQSIAMERADFQPMCRLSLGEAQLLAGHLEEAHHLAERALELSSEHQEHGYQAYAGYLLGAIAVRREAPAAEQAEAYYRQALALADERGMRPLMAHCHLGLGRLYCQMGRKEEARAALSVAIDLYRAMDMTFWLPQAEAALTHLGAASA